MRIVTKQELDIFTNLTAEISQQSAKFKTQAISASIKLRVMSLIGNPEKATAEAIATGERLHDDFQVLLQRFEKSAFTCLGIQRGFGESLRGLFDRVCGLSQKQLVQTIQRNQIQWEV